MNLYIFVNRSSPNGRKYPKLRSEAEETSLGKKEASG